MLLKFDFIVFVVMLKYSLGYIRLLSIFMQFCDLVVHVYGIGADSDAKFHDMYARSISMQMGMTFCRQSQEVHKGKDTEHKSKLSNNYFLPFIDIISNINSQFSQELKAFFLAIFWYQLL